ncbi:MAG: redoxin domain-containing protein [Armatimonadota bacterium]
MRAIGASLVVLAALILATSAGAAGVGRKAPDFTAGGPWVNTNGKALTLADLKGRVVAVEMWTAGCYNCLNVIPSLKQWDARYRQQGLVIVGVHAPEFARERSEQYVRSSVAKLGIRYPVVMDNGFKIWRSYNNVYWPTIYLVDKKGVIRYSHIGEGSYEETEKMIRQLLAESV